MKQNEQVAETAESVFPGRERYVERALLGGQRLDTEERATFDVTSGRQFITDTSQTCLMQFVVASRKAPFCG